MHAPSERGAPVDGHSGCKALGGRLYGGRHQAEQQVFSQVAHKERHSAQERRPEEVTLVEKKGYSNVPCVDRP